MICEGWSNDRRHFSDPGKKQTYPSKKSKETLIQPSSTNPCQCLGTVRMYRMCCMYVGTCYGIFSLADIGLGHIDASLSCRPAHPQTKTTKQEQQTAASTPPVQRRQLAFCRPAAFSLSLSLSHLTRCSAAVDQIKTPPLLFPNGTQDIPDNSPLSSRFFVGPLFSRSASRQPGLPNSALLLLCNNNNAPSSQGGERERGGAETSPSPKGRVPIFPNVVAYPGSPPTQISLLERAPGKRGEKKRKGRLLFFLTLVLRLLPTQR